MLELPTETDPAKVYEGDALAGLTLLPDGCADAVIADPPYCAGGISEASRTRAPGQGLRSENVRRFGWFKGDNMGTAGLCWLLRSVARECRRVVKPSGSLFVFCDWRMLSALQPAIESAGVRYQGLAVWDKGSMGLGTGLRCQHELVMHFTLGAPEYHARDVGNVLRCPRVHATEREHQTQKPVEVLRPLVRLACPPNGIVLDPFAGSGSALVAALREGRRAAGFEEDLDHAATARARIAEALGRGSSSLFAEGA